MSKPERGEERFKIVSQIQVLPVTRLACYMDHEILEERASGHSSKD